MQPKLKIDYLNPKVHTNLAEELSDEERVHLGSMLGADIRNDILSRDPYIKANEKWLKLAAQIVEHKSSPWPNASNVKYPLLTLAAVQFHARALPNLINSGEPVKVRVIGKDDEQQTKRKRASRVAKYMSYQVIDEMENWVDDTDRLMYVLPISGQCHRKIYYSDLDTKAAATLILPNELIINYHAKCMHKARKTQIKYVDQNEMYELVAGDIVLQPSQKPQAASHSEIQDKIEMKQAVSMNPEDQPYQLWECHCFLDLDNDGYKEPYVVTLNSDNNDIIRIVPRWDEDGVTVNEETNELVKLDPKEHYAHYMFLPDPYSATHGMGFGALLGPLNESANTIINQLIDAGTLSNRQVGFLAQGIKLKNGKTRFQPGEWKYVNNNADDLRKGVFPLPIKEPSSVLFQLLGMVIESGQRIASISDMMVGESPGQNQPASTTMAVLEQGLKVFTGIFQRIHRALGKEYKILFELNGEYPDPERMAMILDDDTPLEVLAEDFNDKTMDVIPAADPNIVTDAQKSLKAESLHRKMVEGLPINPAIATRMALEAEGFENIDDIMNVPPKQPDFETQLKMDTLAFEKQKFGYELELDYIRVQAEALKDKAQSVKLLSEAGVKEAKQRLDEFMAQIDAMEKQEKLVLEKIKTLADSNKTMEEAKHVGDKPEAKPAPKK